MRTLNGINISTLKLRDNTSHWHIGTLVQPDRPLPYFQVFAAGFSPTDSGPGEGGRRVGAPGDAPWNKTVTLHHWHFQGPIFYMWGALSFKELCQNIQYSPLSTEAS